MASGAPNLLYPAGTTCNQYRMVRAMIDHMRISHHDCVPMVMMGLPP